MLFEGRATALPLRYDVTTAVLELSAGLPFAAGQGAGPSGSSSSRSPRPVQFPLTRLPLSVATGLDELAPAITHIFAPQNYVSERRITHIDDAPIGMQPMQRLEPGATCGVYHLSCCPTCLVGRKEGYHIRHIGRLAKPRKDRHAFCAGARFRLR